MFGVFQGNRLKLTLRITALTDMFDMIPSVQERKKNVNYFMNSYPNICRLHNTIPNPNIKINNSNNCLDFVGDRLKLDDWKPVLEAIGNDKGLHLISIRSRYSKVKGRYTLTLFLPGLLF